MELWERLLKTLTYHVINLLGQTCEGTDLGGSIRMVGSHSPGGSTVTWSKNSSIPANKS